MEQARVQKRRPSLFSLDRNVIALGWVSFFMDFSSEMLYPLIPLFLTEVLGASKTVLGLIEGTGESVASLLKVASGWFSDRIGRRRVLILGGYGLSTASRPILALAGNWIGVLLFRITDRAGKGIRTSPRDAVVAESTPPESLGVSFGFHRGMDTLGAVAGPLVAWFLLRQFEDGFRWVFWISLLPGIAALLVILVFVRETARQPMGSEGRVPFSLKRFSPHFKIFILVATLFTLGNTSNVFLILRAKQGGIPPEQVTLVYLVFNLVFALSSLPAGWVADRFGKKRVILLGYLLFALVFFLFALPVPPWAIWFLFALFGLYMGMTEGIQRAFVAVLIPPEYKATGYGVYHTAVGVAAFPASLIGGLLWDRFGYPALFVYGAAMALIASAFFVLFFSREGRR